MIPRLTAPLLGFPVLASLLGCVQAAPQAPVDETATVELTIDFGGGKTKEFKQLRWSKELTVLQAMDELAERQPPRLEFKYRGRGATAFLTQIDKMENQGGGSGKKNWVFSVNGKKASKGFGAYKLMPGDKVLWKFTHYQP